MTPLFIIVPVSLIAVSAAGIGVIVFRKFSYLQKLSPGSHQTGQTLWHDLFPELIISWRRIKFKEYKDHALLELEKFLRRIKLVFSTIDRLSDRMIHTVRRVHRESVAAPAVLPADETAVKSIGEQVWKDVPPEVPAVELSTAQPKRRGAVDPEKLKSQEQALIISIAHDVRNPKLYMELGDVYVKMKNYADAEESYKAALKLEPGNERYAKKLSAVLEKTVKKEYTG